MDNFNIKNCEFLKCLIYTNTESEISVYRYIENLIYGKFPQEIVKKNIQELLLTSPEDFTNNIRKIIEKDNKVHYNHHKNIKDIEPHAKK